MIIEAVQHIRRMRGKAQAHLMLSGAGDFYVVKFQNGPQGHRALLNCYLGAGLARAAGLSVPECGVIEVSDWLIDNTPELELDLGFVKKRSKSRPQFASSYVGGTRIQLMDYLPKPMLTKVTNLSEYAGMLAFDKWTGNADHRQAVFSREKNGYRATFIDQGDCFSAGAGDSPLQGTSFQRSVYENITGWESFHPWLERFESMSPNIVCEIVHTIPTEWSGAKAGELDGMVETLLAARKNIRERIIRFRNLPNDPFPCWTNREAKIFYPGLSTRRAIPSDTIPLSVQVVYEVTVARSRP